MSVRFAAQRKKTTRKISPPPPATAIVPVLSTDCVVLFLTGTHPPLGVKSVHVSFFERVTAAAVGGSSVINNTEK